MGTDWIDTDDMERVEAGRIFKGVLHNVTRYCYDYDIGMGNDFKKDILDTIYLMDMDEYYEEVLGWIIEDYRNNVEKMITSKCEALEGTLGWETGSRKAGHIYIKKKWTRVRKTRSRPSFMVDKS